MELSATIASLGYAVPGVVIGVGILIPITGLDHLLADLLEAWFGASVGLMLTGTAVAVILGYQVRFMAVALKIIEGGLSRIPLSLDAAAQTLGCSTLRSLWRVHMPLIRGSLLAAALLVFVDVTKELPATLMMAPPDFNTLAVRVHRLAIEERLAEASTGALAIVLVGLIPVHLLSRYIGQSRPGSGSAT